MKQHKAKIHVVNAIVGLKTNIRTLKKSIKVLSRFAVKGQGSINNDR